MTPAQIDNDWYVLHGDVMIAGPFQTNGEAWRWIDRQSGEPINRAQSVSEWVFHQQAGGSKL